MVLIANITDFVNEGAKFSWYDYILFISMLVLSAIIGIYYGCFGSKQSNASEYLMGGRKMKVIPISMSLIASHLSGVTILGAPTEVYKFGPGYLLTFISITIACIVGYYVFIPIFYELGITSTYEYLKLRFDTKTRRLTSFMFAFGVLLYIPVVIYVPAIAFSQATGINLYYISPIVCGVCIFYTTIGGLKAVVWTDALQFSLTFGAVLTVMIVGINLSGGLTNIFQIAEEGSRLDINFGLDPTKHDTFWSILSGWSVHWISHVGVNQACIQKFLALPTIDAVKRSITFFWAGVIIVKTICVMNGFIIYAKYYDCDPLTLGIVKRDDQMLPYYVLEETGFITGLPGLFIAGVFCTGLSTLSATLNCVAGTIYEDFLVRYLPPDMSQKIVSNILKLLVLVLGVVSTSLVFFVDMLGQVLPTTLSLQGVTTGTTLGIFVLGVAFRRANSTGVFYGALISMAFMCWTVFEVQLYKAQGFLKPPSKPTRTDGCEFQFFKNATIGQGIKEEEIFFLFRLSYNYFAPIGCISTIALGLFISWITGGNDRPVPDNLMAPFVLRLEGKRKESYCVPDVVDISEIKRSKLDALLV